VVVPPFSFLRLCVKPHLATTPSGGDDHQTIPPFLAASYLWRSPLVIDNLQERVEDGVRATRNELYRSGKYRR